MANARKQSTADNEGDEPGDEPPEFSSGLDSRDDLGNNERLTKRSAGPEEAQEDNNGQNSFVFK
jgi:hypothetical protein